MNPSTDYNGIDTIAAVATPVGRGGIGIIRVSGPDATDIGRKLFKRKSRSEVKGAREDASRLAYRSHHLYFGTIRDPKNGRQIDEVLYTEMWAPRSYTREDTVEFHTHSGLAVLKTVLDLVLGLGARLAEPGEYTKRAFLNGRISISEAESVIDVIGAKSERALDAANYALSGETRTWSQGIEGAIRDLLVDLEAEIEFSEEREQTLTETSLIARLKREVLEPVQRALERFEETRPYIDGIQVVITGEANVGKSSLMNRLSHTQRAIVTCIPGTTRDTLETTVAIAGIPIILTDTAGYHRHAEGIEALGIQKAIEKIDSADLVLFMADASNGSRGVSLAWYEKIKKKRHIIVLNKSDLIDRTQKMNLPSEWKRSAKVLISALNGYGIDNLKRMILRGMNHTGDSARSAGFVPNLRQREILKKCKLCCEGCLQAIEDGFAYDLVAIDLYEMLKEIRQIRGEDLGNDIIDRIFATFCIGK